MFDIDNSPHYLFRLPPEQPDPEKVPEIMPQEDPDTLAEEDDGILCRTCLYVITRPEERIIVNGSHDHTFANPSGIVYQIGCFRSAEGCGYAGSASAEFSWFPGFSWRIAVCGRCLGHLGWLFIGSGNDSFHGLILDHLILPA